MEQELISKKVAIIGAGPSGCTCAKFLSDFGVDVTLFEMRKVLSTLLPTGGGKCNLAHAQYDFKELAKNYPRGEKFLYSVFSRFATEQTIEFFNSMGVDTYTREDGHIFPISNSSVDVRNKFIKSFNCKIINEEVLNIEPYSAGYKLTTNKDYFFDAVVVAIGGHAGLKLVENLKISTVAQTPSLVGLVTEQDFSSLAGVSVNDVLFTHKGVSGPYIYKLSSLKARDKFPYKIFLNLAEITDFQQMLNSNPHKEIKNLLGQFVPKSLATYVLNQINIAENTPCHKINGQIRDKIQTTFANFEITVIGKVADGEVVTCGGVDLKEINSKTLESKKYKNLYFCGEILDIDGFCGGFNLQNCWSTGYIVADAIKNNFML